MAPDDWIVAGLVVDVVGGLVLAKGFMLKRPGDILRESRTHFGRNSYIVKSGLLQQGEARVGGILLALGFLAQTWGNLHGGPAANDLGWINSLPRLLLLAFTTTAVAHCAVKVSHALASRVFFGYFFGAYKPDDSPLSGDDWDGLAWLYGTARTQGENDDRLRQRLEDLRSNLGPVYSKVMKETPSGART